MISYCYWITPKRKLGHKEIYLCEINKKLNATNHTCASTNTTLKGMEFNDSNAIYCPLFAVKKDTAIERVRALRKLEKMLLEDEQILKQS